MKKILLTYIAAVFAVFCAGAKNEGYDISYRNLSIERNGANVDISFDISAGRKAVRSDYMLFVQPVLEGESRVELMPVTVQGKRAVISKERKDLSGRYDTPAYYNSVAFLRNGDTYRYTASVPYEEWMHGASFGVVYREEGCCTFSHSAASELSSSLALRIEEPEPVVEPEDVPTTGERLSMQYAFVAEASDISEKIFDGCFTEAEMDRYIDANRDGGLKIYFQQSRSEINSDLWNNRKSLADLMEAVRMIEESPDTELAGVIIAGFASPEGGTEFNRQLAGRRAEALRYYIVSRSSLRNDDVKLYNGAVDWRGLRAMVSESEMKEKYDVLYIIDTYPVWDAATQTGRLGALMRLNRGDTYRYMFQAFFPQLRNAAYIKVYYRDK